MEGWVFWVAVRIGQALEQAAAYPRTISQVPRHLKQASSFFYAEQRL